MQKIWISTKMNVKFSYHLSDSNDLVSIFIFSTFIWFWTFIFCIFFKIRFFYNILHRNSYRIFIIISCILSFIIFLPFQFLVPSCSHRSSWIHRIYAWILSMEKKATAVPEKNRKILHILFYLINCISYFYSSSNVFSQIKRSQR